MSHSRGGMQRINILCAIMIPAIFLFSVGCPSSGSSGFLQGCGFFISNNWPASSGSFESGNLANCPINTPPGGRNQDYQSTATLPIGSTTGDGTLDFSNAHGNFVVQTSSVRFSQSNNHDNYVFTGNYTAGTIAASPGYSAADTAHNAVYPSIPFNGPRATVTAVLTYQTTKAAEVFGASTVDPGMSTTLTVTFPPKTGPVYS